MIVGYARVSMNHQNLDAQLASLQNNECEKIFQEKESATYNHRPVLIECLEFLRQGDTLIITRLDRLARSIVHLNELVAGFDEKGVTFKVIEQHIDTSSASGRLMFNMLGAFAQFERELMIERQMEGIKKAKESGKKFGRSFKLSDKKTLELQHDYSEAGMSIKDICEKYSISRATFYRYNDREIATNDQ